MGRRAFVREQILEAAFTLIAREGYEAVSTRDIAKAAEVGPASMYRHFPTKEDLGRELYSRAVKPLNEQLCAPLITDGHSKEQQITGFVTALYRAYDTNPKALALLIFPPHEFTPDECRLDQDGTVRNCLTVWFTKQANSSNPPPNQADAAAFFWGAVTGPLLDRYLHQRSGKMSDQIQPIINLALRLI